MPKIIGLDQLETQFKEVEKKMQAQVLRQSLVKAVQPLVRAAASDAPKGKTQKLSRSMTTQVMEFAQATEAIVRVGPGRPEGSHGILMEVGTIYMTKRPFLASAFEATYEEIVNEMSNEVRNG